MGYAFHLAGSIRSVGFQAGQLVNLQTFASESLDFLKSKRLHRAEAVRLPSSTNPPQITLTDVVVTRGGRQILQVPKLLIEGGEIIGIVGKEGAGKSTLVKALLGLREITSGSITLSWNENCFELAQINLGDWHRRVGLFNQDFHPPEGFRIGEIVDLGANRGLGNQELTREEAMALADLKDFVSKTALGADSVMGAGWTNGVDFSGGQRKLVGLALALRSNAPVLVLDEPTANISRETGARILHEICRRARAEGRTVIIVSHNFENFHFVDRILGVDDARIVQDGPPEKLRDESGPYRDGVISAFKQNAALAGLHVHVDEDGKMVVSPV